MSAGTECIGRHFSILFAENIYHPPSPIEKCFEERIKCRTLAPKTRRTRRTCVLMEIRISLCIEITFLFTVKNNIYTKIQVSFNEIIKSHLVKLKT